LKPAGLLLSTFVLVFIAELGDKTQIGSFSMATRPGMWPAVALGASVALALSALLAVFFGHRLAAGVPRNALRRVSGALFVASGLWLLARAIWF
jgi:putative Ca2+/H+ antiporter (TMEM165/GDT1 family)